MAKTIEKVFLVAELFVVEHYHLVMKDLRYIKAQDQEVNHHQKVNHQIPLTYFQPEGVLDGMTMNINPELMMVHTHQKGVVNQKNHRIEKSVYGKKFLYVPSFQADCTYAVHVPVTRDLAVFSTVTDKASVHHHTSDILLSCSDPLGIILSYGSNQFITRLFHNIV